MTPSNDAQHRAVFEAPAEEVTVRDQIEGEDGVFEIRMPIASTGDVRNQGDDPLTRDELDGMARQVDTGTVGVFPAHGGDDAISAGRYSPFEKLGTWREGEVEARDEGSDLLFATARMPDPETLPSATGDYRQALAILKEQAMRDITLSASIGWREDDDAPGGNDLMEASIVGIPADPRTTTSAEPAALARAVSAASSDFDPEAFLREFRAATEDDGGTADVDAQSNTTMSDDDTGDDAGTTDDDQNRMDAEEFRESMLEMQQEQTELLRGLAERMDGEDDEEDGDDEDEGEDEQSADTDVDTDGDQDADDATDDGGRDLADEVADLRETLDEIRSGDADVEPPEVDEADGEEHDADTDSTDDNTAAGPAKHGLDPVH